MGGGRKEFSLKNITNALREVRFSSADWYELGVQLELPANQLDTINANHGNVELRLSAMITQWKNADINASWERLADALANISKYGSATGTRLRRAVGLPGLPAGPSNGSQTSNGNTKLANDGKVKTRKWIPYLTIIPVIGIAVICSYPQNRSTIGTFILQFSSKEFSLHGHDMEERGGKDQLPVEDTTQQEEPSVTKCTEITNVQDIFRELREFPKWNQLGVELKISDNALKVIDIEQRDIAGKMQEVLRKWYNMNEKVCWEALTAALKAIDEANLAKKIADKHCMT